MAKINLDLDKETYERLLEDALSERRPVAWQAEIILRRSLGLRVPYPKMREPAQEPAPA